MDPIAIFIDLLTQTSFGLPLLIMAVAAIAWFIASPEVVPPVMSPTPVWREPSPDTVSAVYWDLAAGRRVQPLHYVYERWAQAIRFRYGIYPWEIPTRRKKARKLGMANPKALIRIDHELLELYYKGMAIENRTEGSFAGDFLWEKRRELHWRRVQKAISLMEMEFPELWRG